MHASLACMLLFTRFLNRYSNNSYHVTLSAKVIRMTKVIELHMGNSKTVMKFLNITGNIQRITIQLIVKQ